MSKPDGRLASNAGYAEEAADLLVRYETVAFDDIYAGLLHLLPNAPARVIDIGAGTGRDAAALATRGHQVLAVEPTAAMREGAIALHPDPAIRWLDDRLPHLSRVGGEVFDFALMTAVWMHLDADERSIGMPRIASLLASGGRLLMSLRHGPVPPGRRMFGVTADETIALAESAGLRIVHHDEVASRSAGNTAAGVRWSRLAFDRI